MKKILFIVSAFIFLVSCEQNSDSPQITNEADQEYGRKDLPKPDSLLEKVSYAYGYDITRGLLLLDSATRKQFSIDYFIAGLRDGLKDTIPMFNEEETIKILQEFQKLQAEQDKERYNRKFDEAEKLGEEFKDTYKDFLAENKSKEGWITTDSGLQYKVLKEGTGPKPAYSDVIKVHILGTLMNGQTFENTFKVGQPIDMPIEGLQKGFQEAFQLMNEKGKYKFVIPPELAYGEEGNMPSVPPYSPLILEVEYLENMGNVDEYKQNPPLPAPMMQ